MKLRPQSLQPIVNSNQLTLVILPEAKSLPSLQHEPIQDILYPHGVIPNTRPGCLGAGHAEPAAAAREHLSHDLVAHVAGRVGVDTILVQGLLGTLEDAGGVPGWVHRGSADSLTAVVARETFGADT